LPIYGRTPVWRWKATTNSLGQYAEIMYGVKPQGEEDKADGDEDEEEDIEASVKRELDAMRATGKEAKLAGRIFTPVKMNVACLLFVRTRAPVDPVAFVKRICQDARSGSQKTRSRYVNRLVPMTAVGRATEAGLVELATKVLGEVFDLGGKGGDEAAAAEKQPTEDSTEKTAAEPKDADDKADGGEPAQSFSVGNKVGCHREFPWTLLIQVMQFAIRPSIRNNTTLKRDVIIQTVAKLVNSQRHKVNLEKPDKVILVEVYQVCADGHLFADIANIVR
jgi:tRNA acetyltransferase TAN1